jgi:predicted protein tyrosine phosphatase
MAHPQLAIYGYSEAAMFLRGTPKPDVAGIISIHGQREFGVEADAPRRLDLHFDDVDVPPTNDIFAIQRAMSRRRWALSNGLVERAPTCADAQSIIDFAQAVHGDGRIVLCHCSAGMSRAPAAALICLAVWRGPGTEADCVSQVRQIRRGAVPHIGLIRFADTLL